MSELVTIQPQQQDILAMIEATDKAASTKKQYTKALTGYLATGGDLADSQALADYAGGLCNSSRAFLKAAIRLWGEHVVTQAKAGATPENIAAVQATEARFEALNESIKVKAAKGQKAHTWLTQSEVKRLLDTCHPKNGTGET